MRKILNFALIFTLSVLFVGFSFTNVVAEATEDVTITIHVHQYDGVYTNTGAGIWDGITWNGWGDLVDSTDDFGGVIVKEYTAAEINAVNAEIQFELTSESTSDDDTIAQANYLSPGEGKIMLDVSSLKDGSITNLEVYYVEGATGFVEAVTDKGLLFIVYANPIVAADATVYDGWDMWSWFGAGDGIATDFNQDMVLKAGEYEIPAKLAIIEVAADIADDTGFLFRTGGNSWTSQTSDVEYDNTDIRGSGADVIYFEAGVNADYTDGSLFLTSVATAYDLNAGNRFMSGTIVSTPTAVKVEFLMPKNPISYDLSRFKIVDILGANVPIESVTIGSMAGLGSYTSDTTCGAGENMFVLYVTSSLDHSLLGIVGSLQGWDIETSIASTKDDVNGNAVFEICTTETSGKFKLVYDPDGDGFDDSWNQELDPHITLEDQEFDFEGETTVYYYINVSDIQVGTYTQEVFPDDAERHIVVYVDSALDHTKLGIVGDVQENAWTPAEAITSTQDDAMGYAVFEFVILGATGTFKVLFDNSDDGFDWGDAEVTPDDQSFDMGSEYSLILFIDELTPTAEVVDLGTGHDVGAYTQEVFPTVKENYVRIYVDSAADHTKIGIVGTLNGWDQVNAVTSTGDDSNGFAVFEFAITDTTGAFKVLIDNSDDGFDWGDSIHGSDQLFDMGTDDEIYLFVDETSPDVEVVIIGSGHDVGTYTQTVTPVNVSENYVRIYVDSAADHTKIGIVGTLNGWNDVGAITSTGDDSNGLAVFEFVTTDTTGAFKVLIDADDNGFTWADSIHGSNQLFDMGTDTEIYLFVDETSPDVQVLTLGSGHTIGSYTHAVTPVNNYLVIYLDSALDHTKIGIVGDMQTTAWDPASAITSSGDDANGLAVFEVDTTALSGGFKIIFDNDDNGFNWGDTEITPADQAFDFDGETELSLFIDEASPTAEIVIAATGPAVGTYTATLTPVNVDEKYVVIYVDSALDHSLLRLVGDMQGWDIDNPISSTGDSSTGLAVFEFVTTGTTGEFKIMFDTSDDGLTWDNVDDVQITPSNQAYNLGTEMELSLYVDESDPTVEVVIASSGHNTGTFTQTVIPDVKESYVLIYVDSALDHSLLGLVGDVQGWDINNPIMSTQDDVNGYAVFEIAIVGSTGTFKILFDTSGDGFAWDNADDVEVTTEDQSFDMGDDDSIILFIDELDPTAVVVDLGTEHDVKSYTQEVFPKEAQKYVVIYVDSALDHTKLGLVGTIQGWDVVNPILSTKDDSYGQAIFEFVIDGSTGSFKILFDNDDNGFNWGDTEITTSDQAFDMGEDDSIILFVDELDPTVQVVVLGSEITDLSTAMVTLNLVTANELQYGEVFYIQYTDALATGTEDAVVIESEELTFDVSNNFVAPVVIDETGTYAISPTSILVAFENGTLPMSGLELQDSTGTVIDFATYEYTNGAIGDFTSQLTCAANENKLTVHVNLFEANPISLSQIRLVGDVQGWDIGNTVPSIGIDSNGNYVIQLCVSDSTTSGTFKIKYDKDLDGITWDSVLDPEITPGDIGFNFDGDTHVYVEEGGNAAGSVNHSITLLEANKLDVTETYRLVFTDENGFIVYINLDIDNEAPELFDSVVPDVVFEIDEGETFDIMDYFTQLQFVDNRDGEIDYEITTSLDTSTPGVQTVIITATDAWMNVTTSSFVFTVLDITAPVFTADDTLTYTAGDTEPDWATFASVNEGTITIDESQVNMANAGSFYVIYTATDDAGNTSTYSLEVVIEAAAETPALSPGAIVGIVVGGVAVVGGGILFFLKKPF